MPGACSNWNSAALPNDSSTPGLLDSLAMPYPWRSAMATKPYIIDLEEHSFAPEVKRHTIGQEPPHAQRILERLDDVGELRLREMDEAGVDLQVLSHAHPGLQKLDAGTAGRVGAR